MYQLKNLCTCVCIHSHSLYTGGDEGLGETRAERGVLLPDREHGSVHHGSVRSDLPAADCGPGRSQRCPGPTCLQSHPAAQKENRSAGPNCCGLCRLPLGHQGGESGHVRQKTHSKFAKQVFPMYLERTLEAKNYEAAVENWFPFHATLSRIKKR